MKIYLETTGCRLNQSEIETLAHQFRQVGHEIVSTGDQADLCVVNTCAVTQDAARTSRMIIRRLNRDNPMAQMIVTGCYAHLSPDTVAALPGVTQVINNIDKDRLIPLVLNTATSTEVFDQEPLDREQGARAMGRTRAFIKVQDGCNNRCTFCVTTIARGPGRSRPAAEIVHEVQAFSEAGYQEAVLTGVHLGSYGHERIGLHTLIELLLAETNIPRLRLSSLEPWDINLEFFALWQNPRLCRHLHLPLQSGCDATLRRMARRTSQSSFRALVESARAQITGLGISTDLITGFPGETDEEFESSLAFVREMDFMKLHVFRYSPRAGTAAARMPGQVQDRVKKDRSLRLLALSDEGAQRFAARFIGQDVSVLWEHITGASETGFYNSGLTDNYIRVDLTAPAVLTNTISTVRIASVTERGLQAVISPAKRG